MRYVSDVKPVVTGPSKRPVSGVSSVQALKPVHPREQTVSSVDVLQAKHKGMVEAEKEALVRLPLQDRRKVCRRVNHQKVLIELRSGVDRRKHDLFASGPRGHIDEKA